jgi:ribosomal protein S27AE
MNKTKICPKCQGEMIAGHYTGPMIEWEVEGDQSFLKKEGITINTFACKRCGFMESYVQK